MSINVPPRRSVIIPPRPQVIKLHLDTEEVGNALAHAYIKPYLTALFEAMKTKPKSEDRTITYYPEAVELKGTVKDDEEGNRVFVREE